MCHGRSKDDLSLSAMQDSGGESRGAEVGVPAAGASDVDSALFKSQVVKHSKKSSPTDGSEEHDQERAFLIFSWLQLSHLGGQERPPTTWQALPPAALSLAEALFAEDLKQPMEQQRLLQLAEGLYRLLAKGFHTPHCVDRRHIGALSSSYVQQAVWFKLICRQLSVVWQLRLEVSVA